MNNIRFYPRLFIVLSVCFILATAVGTVTHELGHIAVAQSMGYSTKLFYASSGRYTPQYAGLESYYEKNKSYITSKKDSPQKKRFLEWYNDLAKQDNRIVWGGPLQTAFTGTVGILLLFCRRKKIIECGMQKIDWFFVLLSFFWSREICNYFMSLFSSFKGHHSHRDDESKIDYYYHLPYGTTGIITAVLAAILLYWVVFFIIPKHQRFTFIVAGFFGSLLGWVIWMRWLGPIVLP